MMSDDDDDNDIMKPEHIATWLVLLTLLATISISACMYESELC